MDKRCTKTSYAQYYGSRCNNPGKVQHEGKWFCGVHDPIKKKARADERSEKWAAERNAFLTKHERQKRALFILESVEACARDNLCNHCTELLARKG